MNFSDSEVNFNIRNHWCSLGFRKHFLFGIFLLEIYPNSDRTFDGHQRKRHSFRKTAGIRIMYNGIRKECAFGQHHFF